ncbi:50S ribosomal protein L25/general stress protein Ctc [Micropruina sonneratiae]|uniref:50S ribosomal protein L25/general stress protein Ctc n=1 Tax=Micropruina sonneratiae TaxID=2986940 RepID=UPI002226FA7C|nr:50S ribosomal protein L25/general stress protein Ctc [Micropruina sp. KQZ13P-5]MCW3158884.1 50S ribosomal protein L25/general stress protein Ctc [Micropruina sp. KQZ13P-5]
MAEIKISAKARTEFGKGAARRARRDGLVPAVLYGHGTDPVHVSLPGHETLLALRAANALLSISIDGNADQLALPKQVQRNPVKGTVEHVDLVIVKRGEKVTVEVPLNVIGADERADRVVVMDQQTITLEVEATNIPRQIDIDVTALEIGDSIAAKDLDLPEGAVFPGEPDDLILSISAAKTQEQIDAELDAAVADVADDEAAAAPVEQAGDEAEADSE